MKLQGKVDSFNSAWRSLDIVYEEYAKKIGMTYTSLHIFNLIVVIEDCTQKKLCERAFLPKQTVNAVITNFIKQGWVELKELKEDRRNKTIHLTQKGKQVAEDYVIHIQNAERRAMAAMSNDLSNQLIEGMNTYEKVFRKEMLDD